MISQLFRTAGVLLAAGLLQTAMMRSVAAQQTGVHPGAYDGTPSYTQPPRELPMMPSRNFGDVLSGALKNASVRTASNEEPVKPGIVEENGTFVNSEGEIYEGEFYGEGCEDCGEGCYPPCCGTFYARGEYLMWWLSGDSYPPLVTTSPDGTPRSEAGLLGESDTSILFGNQSFNDGSRNGTRVVMGTCLTPYTRLEGDWFTLGSNGAEFHQSSDGSPILARPFFNLSSGAQDANLVAFPGELEGRVDVRADTQFMGAGMHLARNLSYYCAENGCGYHRIDLVYGFRWLGLYEDFDADSSSTVTGESGTLPIGTVFNVSDSFVTSNNFYGGNIGVSMESNRGRWFLTSAARLGIGGTRERVSVAGSTSVALPDEDPADFDGGLLALPTNIGRYSQNSFGLVPHIEVRVAYMLTPRMRWTLGYDLLYWSRVVRPGDQVDLFVNPTQASDQPLVGTPGPLFPFKESDLWIQGISTGLEFQF